MKFTKAKAYVALLALIVTALTGAFADDVLSLNEVSQFVALLIESAVGAYAVWKTPNKVIEVRGSESSTFADYR